MSSTSKSWTFLDTTVQRSFAWSVVLSLLPVISSFIISWFVARWAGPSVWGTISWAMAFATAVLIVGKFGLELGASRLASEFGVSRPGSLRNLLRTAMGYRLLFTLPVAALSLIFARQIAGWFNEPVLTGPIRVAAGIIACASVYEFKEHFLIGLNRHKTVSKVRSVTLFIRISLTVILVLAGFGATSVLSGYCVAWLIGISVFGVLLVARLPRTEQPENPQTMTRRLMSLSVPLAISSASVTIYSQTDKLMLGYFNGVEEVGYYAVARAVTEVSLFPAFAFVMTLRPALASRFSSGALGECADLIRKSLRVSLIFGVLFATIFAVLAVPLMTFVYSLEFKYAGELMAVFIWVIVLRSLGAMVLPALVAAERTKVYAYLTFLTAVVNVGLNLVLIPKFDAKGAIIATIVSYGFLFILGLGRVFQIFHVRVGLRATASALRTVLAGALAGGVLWLLGRAILGASGVAANATVLMWVVILTVIYGAFLLVMRVVRPQELKSIAGGFRI